MHLWLKVILCLCFFSTPSWAEDVELTADNRVEWHQKEQKVVAIGNAVATRKDMTIKAHEMSADYRKDVTTNKTQITIVHAKGNVIMTSPTAKAFGETMDYDLSKDSVVLQGEPAKIKTATDTITATDGITYFPEEKKAIAIGNVQATNGKDKIFGDKMVAYFEPRSISDDSLEMKKVDIYGHVKIINAETTVWADKGSYNPKAGLVRLYDNVTINQNGNKLHGDYAQSDLNSGVSKMMAGATSKQRVTGIFKEKQKDDKSSSQRSKKK